VRSVPCARRKAYVYDVGFFIMTNRQRDMTTAYVRPAESLYPTEDLPNIPAYQITPAEARHSLLGTAGVFLLAYTLPVLYEVVIVGRWERLDPRMAALLAAVYLGCVLAYRYTYDIVWVLNNQFRVIWSLEKDLVDTLRSAAEIDQALTNERSRAQRAEAQLELLRRQPTTTRRGEFTPYDGPPLNQMPDFYAPYDDHPLPTGEQLRAGVDVEPEDESIDEWINQVLRHYEDPAHGHIRRDGDDGVMRVRGLKRRQYDQARDKLIDLGIIGGNSATGYHILAGVDYDAAITTYLQAKYVGR
jgi:hypothetical protein